MIVPKKFKESILEAYKDSSKINDIFVKNRIYLLNYAKRFYYKIHTCSRSYLDVEDLFQIICELILDYMWDFDDTLSNDIVAYVLYNVGSEMQKIVKRSYIQSQRTTLSYIDSIDKDTEIDYHNHLKNSRFKNILGHENLVLKSDNVDLEIDIKNALSKMLNDSPLNVRLITLLIKHEGNISDVAREIKEKNLIKGYSNKSLDNIRITVCKKKISKIRSKFIAAGIIPKRERKIRVKCVKRFYTEEEKENGK